MYKCWVVRCARVFEFSLCVVCFDKVFVWYVFDKVS